MVQTLSPELQTLCLLVWHSPGRKTFNAGRSLSASWVWGTRPYLFRNYHCCYCYASLKFWWHSLWLGVGVISLFCCEVYCKCVPCQPYGYQACDLRSCTVTLQLEPCARCTSQVCGIASHGPFGGSAMAGIQGCARLRGRQGGAGSLGCSARHPNLSESATVRCRLYHALVITSFENRGLHYITT